MDLSIHAHSGPPGFPKASHQQHLLASQQHQIQEGQHLQQEGFANGTKMDDVVPTLAVLWRSVAKGDGKVTLMDGINNVPIGLQDLFLAVKPGNGAAKNGNMMTGMANRAAVLSNEASGEIYEDTIGNDYAQAIRAPRMTSNGGRMCNTTDGGNLGTAPRRMNSLAQTANSTYSNIASDIVDAGTYSPTRMAFEGYNPSIWNDNHGSNRPQQWQSHNPYRVGFGGYTSRYSRGSPSLMSPSITTTNEAQLFNQTFPHGQEDSFYGHTQNDGFVDWCRGRLNSGNRGVDVEGSGNGSSGSESSPSGSPGNTVLISQAAIAKQRPISQKGTQQEGYASVSRIATLEQEITPAAVDDQKKQEQQQQLQDALPSPTILTNNNSNNNRRPGRGSPVFEKLPPGQASEKSKAQWRPDAKVKGAIRQGLDNLALAAPMLPAKGPRAVIIKGRNEGSRTYASSTELQEAANDFKGAPRGQGSLYSATNTSQAGTTANRQYTILNRRDENSRRASNAAQTSTSTLQAAAQAQAAAAAAAGVAGASTVPQSPSPARPTYSPVISPFTGLPPPHTPSPDATLQDNPYDIPRPRGIKRFCTYYFRTRKCDFYLQQGCAYSHDIYAYVLETFPEKLALYTAKYKITAEKMTEQEMWDVMDLRVERVKEFPPPDLSEMELNARKWRMKRELSSRPINVTITAATPAEVLGGAKKKKEKAHGGAFTGGSKKAAATSRGGKAVGGHSPGSGKVKPPQSITIRASSVRVSEGPTKRATTTSAKKSLPAKGKGKKSTATSGVEDNEDEGDDENSNDAGDESSAPAAEKPKVTSKSAKEDIDNAGFLKNTTNGSVSNSPPTGPAQSKRQPVPINSQPWKNMKKHIADAAVGISGGKGLKVVNAAQFKGKDENKAGAQAEMSEKDEDILLPGIESQTGMKVEVGGGEDGRDSAGEMDLISIF